MGDACNRCPNRARLRAEGLSCCCWEAGTNQNACAGALPADKPLGIGISAPRWLDVASALSSSPGLLQSLNIFLEALEGVQSVIPKDKFLAITSAVFYQVRGAYPCAQSSFPLGYVPGGLKAPSL